MRSYFYHLAFELYPYPNSNTQNSRTGEQEIYLPPPGTDIFESELPVHRVTPWGAHSSKRSSHKRTKTDILPVDRPKARTVSFHQPRSEESHQAFTFIDPPRTHGNPVSQHLAQLSLNSPTEDWRYESITVESIDMASGSEDLSRPRGKSLTHNADTSSGGGLDTRAKFISPDNKKTDIGWGVVHLYRDGEETPGLYDETYTSSTTDGGSDFIEEECAMLCILAVPSYMMPSDLLGWAGERAREDVSHFRLIRTGKTNRYMVLMKFRDAEKAKAWRDGWNGKTFSSMEPEFCQAVFIKSITFGTGNNALQPSSFPSMSNDPFMPNSQPVVNAPTTATAESSSLGAALSVKPFAPPTPNLVELPTCPVCLERMDETTGLLTILCQHVFHCECLEKWRGSGCPVCRYTQNSVPSGLRSDSQNEAENFCSVCNTTENLWICLICGNVGCGRYESAHAHAHYESTTHSYAMDVTNQHVWDYTGDGYVHRLIQNKSDGKLVDLPAAWAEGKNASGGMAAMGADMVPREKMEAMGNEYSYLLTSQLENQRSYFEEQVERAVDKASEASAAADKATAALESMLQAFAQLQEKNDEAQDRIQSLEKDVERSTRKSEKTDALAKKLAKDWKEEKTINEALMEKLRFKDEQLKVAEEKQQHWEAAKAELEEQNRDLIFSITGGEKLQQLKEAGEDVDGTIEVPVQELGGSRRRKGKGKR